MCRLCGREACAECFEQVKVLTDNSGAEDANVFELQARREKHSRKNPFFLACTRRNEHQAKDFSPMTRFCKSELEVVIKEMEELLTTPDPNPPRAEDVATPDSDVEMAPDDQTGSLPIHHILEFKHEDLSYDVFTKLWAKGKPLVVTGLLPRFKINWTPEHFIENYGSKSCLVIQCQSDMNKRITVGDFFKEFGKYEGRQDCWKLKVILVALRLPILILRCADGTH
jgi:lysine-specific demethylase 3